MATNYREILRLAKLGYSQRSIAASAGCARSTVQRVLERAGSNPHTLEELLALSDKGIQQALFPASSIPFPRGSRRTTSASTGNWQKTVYSKLALE